MSDNFSLPGFATPESPREKERIIVEFGQEISCILKSNVPLDDRPTLIKVYMAKEMGNETNLVAELDKGKHVFENKIEGSDRKEYVLRVPTYD